MIVDVLVNYVVFKINDREVARVVRRYASRKLYMKTIRGSDSAVALTASISTRMN